MHVLFYIAICIKMPCIYSCILLSKPEARSLLGFELLLIVEKLFPIIMLRLADIWHRGQSFRRIFCFVPGASMIPGSVTCM